MQGTDGNSYGMTFGSGANNLGAVFRISPTGSLTALHSFDGTDGENPAVALIHPYARYRGKSVALRFLSLVPADQAASGVSSQRSAKTNVINRAAFQDLLFRDAPHASSR